MTPADLATFKQDTANEFAQLRTMLQKTIDDLVDATRRTIPGEPTNGAGELGPALGGSTDGTLLASLDSPGAARPGQSIGDGPGGRHVRTRGQARRWPRGGYGYGDAHAGAGGPSTSSGPASGIAASSGAGVGYRSAPNGAGTAAPPTGHTGGLAVSAPYRQMGMLT